MSSHLSSLVLLLSVCLSVFFQAFAQQTPLVSGPEEQLCYFHEYNLVNETLANGTVVTDTPQFICNDTSDFFTDPSRFSIDYATKTIKNVTFSNTYVDVIIDVTGTDYHVRFVVCGCPLPPDSATKNATVFTNPKNLFVPDGPAVHLISEQPLTYTPIAYIDSKLFKYNAELRRAVERNEVQEIGTGSGYNWATLVDAADVSAAVLSTFSFSSQLETANSFKFNGALLPSAEANEQDPLARAEWVKVIGLLFYQTAFANTLFDDIVTDYEQVKKKAAKASRLPTVVFNYPFKSVQDDGTETFSWAQPGSQDYIGRFIEDAYANHRYLPTSTSAAFLNISTTTEDFKAADYFLNSQSFPSSENLTQFFDSFGNEDATRDMKQFASIRCGKLWAQDNRVNGSANDYFESGISEPHTVLKDFVSILHPELDFVKDYEPVYMRNIPRGDVEFEDFAECPYAEFQHSPAEGSAYVDKTFNVSGLTIFEVQDAIEPDMLPVLEEAGIPKLSVQFRFPERAVANATHTVLTVRRNLSSADAEEFSQTDSVLVALQTGLNVTVEELSSEIVQAGDDDEDDDETPSDEPKPSDDPDNGDDDDSNDDDSNDDDSNDDNSNGDDQDGNNQGEDDDDDGGGLSGGAIAGIVIAVLVVVGVAAFAFIRSRGRSGLQ